VLTGQIARNTRNKFSVDFSKMFFMMIKRLVIAESNKLTGDQQENRKVVAVQVINGFGFGVEGFFQIDKIGKLNFSY
jgi:hypothetical protein